jgi:hypothetical protein
MYCCRFALVGFARLFRHPNITQKEQKPQTTKETEHFFA